MQLGMGLVLEVSQSLQLRQQMEHVLQMSLSIIQEIKLTLELYLKREDVLTRLYKEALEDGRVRQYEKHGMKFEYALVSKKDLPPKVLEHGLGFSHCLFKAFDAVLFGRKYALARGSWLLFVVYDMFPDIPDGFLEYVAVHERGEQVTLGDHNAASKLEFAIAKKEERLQAYMAWLEAHYPTKFSDVYTYQTHLVIPEAEKFQEVLDILATSEEAEAIRLMIERFEWPYRVLQRLLQYKKRHEEAMEHLTQGLRFAEVLAGEGGMKLPALVAEIREAIQKHLRRIADRGLTRYINYTDIEEVWHARMLDVDRVFVAMLSRKDQRSPEYLQEVINAGISTTLPRNGVLAMSFREALEAAQTPRSAP